jgi:arylsulfatase
MKQLDDNIGYVLKKLERDPFEQFVEPNDSRSLTNFGGALTAPSTSFLYDGLAIMPLGQQLWLKELESYQTYPPLRAPETYNLTQVMTDLKKAHEGHRGD